MATRPQALILGDSQAQRAGIAIAADMESAGFAVTRSAHSGYSGAKLVGVAPDGPFALVLVMVGGNDGTNASLAYVDTLIEQYHGSKLVFMGPPPATAIQSIAAAQAVFGAGVQSATQWFDNGTAQARETRNAALRQAVGGRASWLDWRALSPFPAQQDGIHASQDTARAWLQVADVPWRAPKPSPLPVIAALTLGWLTWRMVRKGKVRS